MIQIWHDCSKALERELTPQQFIAWIKPLRAIAYDPDSHRLRLGAPSRLKLDAIVSHFAARIRATAAELAQHPVDIDFEVAAVPSPEVDVESMAPPNEAAAADAGVRLPNDGVALPMAGTIEHVERARLQPGLTFDTFVTGKANQLARAAAMQVAENPGGSYNPLFLYGGVGLGKTHLVHAVGNGILARKPNAKVRYIHAEQYVSDVVRAYQKKAFDEFKRYYHSLDLLLIDDIQFFGGKSRTQEEFFYAFEALVAGKKQIIITSDTYPKELKDIEDRLVSRFSSGLTVGIEPPELEMRVAILLKKAELERAELSEEVAFFIAKNLRSNVRELEGALKRVVAYARFTSQPITMELVKEALKDILAAGNRVISIETIQKTMAEYYKIELADMHSKKRSRDIARPRQVAMALAKELTSLSLPNIGDAFGGRDHTTVLHAVRKIGGERQKNSELNQQLHVLEQTLKG